MPQTLRSCHGEKKVSIKNETEHELKLIYRLRLDKFSPAVKIEIGAYYNKKCCM